MKYFSIIDKNTDKKHEVLEQLFVKYNKLMYYTAYQILQDQYLAEDAVQTAFLKLEKNKFKFYSISCNKTKCFMVIIVRNIAINLYNSKKKEIVTYDEDELMEIPDDHLLPLDVVINNERIGEINQLLDSLDSKYADVISMRYFSDYSIEEIASLFDISEQLVRVRLYRAKKLILEQINEGELLKWINVN